MSYRAKDGRVYPYKETHGQYQESKYGREFEEKKSKFHISQFIPGIIIWGILYAIIGNWIWLPFILCIIGGTSRTGKALSVSVSEEFVVRLIGSFFAFWLVLFVFNLFVQLLPFLLIGGALAGGIYIYIKSRSKNNGDQVINAEVLEEE